MSDEEAHRAGYAGDSYGVPAPPELTVPQFESLCQEIYNKRSILDGFKEEQKKLQADYDEACRTVFAYMVQYNKKSYPVSNRGTLIATKRLSVKVPQDPADKQTFFNYLKERNLFDAFITVNFQTINAFYREEQKQAIDSGAKGFSMPGIGEPVYMDILQVRKK